jgi:hypothetical protein
MAGFPIFTPPSPAPFFNLPNQPNYSGGIAAGIGGIGESFRANRAEDFAAQKLADENAYRNASLEVQKRGQDITAATSQEREIWGVTPIYGTDAQGKPTAFLTSSKGNTKPFEVPGGGTLTKTPIKLDMGSYFVLVDPITNQPVPGPDGRPQILQKDPAGEASLKKQGELQGAAAANVAAIDDAQKEFNRGIDEVINDPYLDAVVGPVDTLFPSSWDLHGDKNRVNANIANLIGQTFLTAYDRLKGSGPISEGEGAAAKEAINKLKFTNVSDATYREYLQQAKDRMAELADLARKKAGAQPMTSAAPPMIAPAPGTTAPAASGAPAPAAPASGDPAGIR